MSQELHKSPATPYVPLVVFQGTSISYRYARWTENLTVNGHVFTSAPELSIQFDKAMNVGVEDSPLTIQLRNNRPPIDRMSLPFPHSPVRVTVCEVDPMRIGDTFREVYFGKVTEVDSSTRGSHVISKVTVSGIKASLTRIVGLQALSTCIWSFGQANQSPCGFNVGPHIKVGEITAVGVDGQSVRINTNLAYDPYLDLSNMRWANGQVSVSGHHVKIRQSLEDGRFDLKSPVPLDWIGLPAIFSPGCGKTLANCRYWDNEARFMGLGLGMPGANPVFSRRR